MERKERRKKGRRKGGKKELLLALVQSVITRLPNSVSLRKSPLQDMWV
jgi:hypothetical protein